MSAKDKPACTICGTPIPAGSSLCPICALRGALEPEGTETASFVEPALSIAQLRFEHYEILAREDGTPIELGRGAMGVTYKAIDVNLRRTVALKVINARLVGDESASRRLLREARAAASLRHPNVASVFHLGKSGDTYFYAMEFVDGESLDKVIRRFGRLDPATALKVTALVAAGLDAIDNQKLIHRDIKPSNIIVSLDADNVSYAKIIDLGLAKGTAAGNGSISEISAEGAFAGTPQYASPEQFAGIGADIRSDIYSLGITLWEMVAGEVPFKGSASRLTYQHQHAPLPVNKLTQVPQPVIALLEVLLDKDPDRRFQSPVELLGTIPRVSAAIDSGRRLVADQLRSGTDEAVPKSGEDRQSEVCDRLQRFRASFSVRRLRIFEWPLALALVVVVLLSGLYFFYSHRGPSHGQPGSGAAQSTKSIAVLPFENISPNKDDAYFADGVQHEILNNLARIAQLKVISRTSVMQYRSDTKRDLRQIANALGVANVLEGTVRRNGNRVRVSTELIDARNDHTIWADSYDRDLSDIFAIQSDVAQTIASKLTTTLSPEEKKRIEAKPTENLEAYDLYLRAAQLIANASLNSFISNVEKPLRDAIELLEQAVRLDPKFALAYCAATNAHDWLYQLYDQTSERRTLGDTAIDTALRLQPALPDVHLAYASHLYRAYRDYERARVQLAIARQSMPNNTEALQLEAFIDRREGNYGKAVQELKEASTLDPRNPYPVREMAGALCVMRQFSAAKQAYDRAIELAPDQPPLKILKAFVSFYETGVDTLVRAAIDDLPRSMANEPSVLCLHLSLALGARDWQRAKELVEKLKGGQDEGDFGYAGFPVPINSYLILITRVQGNPPGADSSFVEAREELNQAAEKSPGVAPLVSTLALVDALLGKKEDAIAEAKRAAEMLPVSRDAVDGPGIQINLALVYAWTGESELAIATLAPLTKVPNGPLYGPLIRDPIWDPLRKDPRFEKLLAELAPRTGDGHRSADSQ